MILSTPKYYNTDLRNYLLIHVNEFVIKSHFSYTYKEENLFTLTTEWNGKSFPNSFLSTIFGSENMYENVRKDSFEDFQE